MQSDKTSCYLNHEAHIIRFDNRGDLIVRNSIYRRMRLFKLIKTFERRIENYNASI